MEVTTILEHLLVLHYERELLIIQGATKGGVMAISHEAKGSEKSKRGIFFTLKCIKN